MTPTTNLSRTLLMLVLHKKNCPPVPCQGRNVECVTIFVCIMVNHMSLLWTGSDGGVGRYMSRLIVIFFLFIVECMWLPLTLTTMGTRQIQIL